MKYDTTGMVQEVWPGRCGLGGVAWEVWPGRCGLGGVAWEVWPGRCGLGGHSSNNNLGIHTNLYSSQK